MKTKLVSYLDQVRFTPNLWNSIQARYITNIRLVILLILSIIILGMFSVVSIPRRLNPEINIPIVVVNTLLPGAGPTDVESLVTTPLEDTLKDLKGIDTITSSSRDNVSTIIIQFLSTVDGEKAKADAKSAIDTVTTLPTDAKTPNVSLLDFEDQPIWNFVVTTKKDKASLMRFSTVLKDRIDELSKVDRVTTSGTDTREVSVIIHPEKIAAYNINPFQLSQLIQKTTTAYPAGTVDATNTTFALSIDPDVTTVNDLRNLQLSNMGQVFSLSDVAQVSERSGLTQQKTYFANRNVSSADAVQFFVYKASGANIDAAEQDVKKVVEETVRQFHNEFEVTTILNTAESIVEQFNDLFSEFRSTIILVFVLLVIFLGFRQAAISSLTVPLTFLSTFAIINMLGLSLNFLTLFAFLIALGLLIDDTIVTVAAMTRYYATGRFTPSETGILVWRDFIVPLWSTTITTIWAFVPLLIASGIIGEFIKSIPIVVTATLLSSTTIAVFITLPLMIVFLKPQFPKRVIILLKIVGLLAVAIITYSLLPKSELLLLTLLIFFILLFVLYQSREYFITQYAFFIKRTRYGRLFRSNISYLDTGIVKIEMLSERYMRIIDRILRSKAARRSTLIAIISFSLIGYSLLPLGLVKSEFFPKTDEDLLYINVDLPAGTNLKTTNTEVLQILPELRNYDYIDFIIAETGTRFSQGDRSGENASFLITLHLLPKEERKLSSQQIAEELRDTYKSYTKGTLTIQELSSGPPAGADIQIKLLGSDLGVLDTYANKIQSYLKTQPGVTNPEKSIKSGTSKIVFVPDKTEISSLGLTIDAVASWLRMYASGLTLDTLKIDDEDTDIIFRMGGEVPSIQSLGSIMIPTQSGNVPLLSLGKLQLENNPTSIEHEGGRRTISVAAGVAQGVSTTEKNKDVEKFADTLNLPEGYSWQTGGVNEENQKSVNSILQAMIISFILILITMVIEFGSFRQALIALLIIPLAVSSVFYVFALTGTPLSFPALIGILALFGIVVTHAIVVIEKINDNRKHGMNLHDAIVDAAGGRLEPVLLTSLATIVGLIPITVADPLWRGLGGAIISGLLFSGLIKLFFVPVMYYNWFNEDRQKSR